MRSLVHNGVVYSGNTGKFRALDASDGSLLWDFSIDTAPGNVGWH